MLKLSAVTRNTIRSHGKIIGLASRGDFKGVELSPDCEECDPREHLH